MIVLVMSFGPKGVSAEEIQRPVLIIEATGGCFMGGPNCPRYELRKDGSFSLVRLNENKIEKEASLDPKMVIEWIRLVENTDISAMIAKLGPGTCNSCIDGVDFKYEVNTQRNQFTLESTEVDFFKNQEPFFSQTEKILRAMMGTAKLEIKKR